MEGDLATPQRQLPARAAKTNHAMNFQNPGVEMGYGQEEDHFEGDHEPLETSGTPFIPTTPGRGRKRRGGGVDPAPKRGRGGGRGRGRGRRVSGMGGELDGDEDVSSLFAVIRNGKATLQTTVADWIDDYDKDPENSLLQLLQFFISSAGCKGVITQNLLNSGDFKQIIRKMTEEFDEESGEYPLVMTGPMWKRFRLRFYEFVQILIEKSQRSIIFDGTLMHNVISMLTSAADSQVRAFRHTATYGALALITALVDASLELNRQRSTIDRQHDTELAKQRDRRGGNERLETLIRNRNEIGIRSTEVQEMYGFLFKSVFIHRYRDVVPEIRAMCIQELGIWMEKFPSEFLDDSYLKYIGWTIYDKIADVRGRCLTALIKLYEEPEMYQKLELFTNKFKDRLVSMVRDVDSEVATKALKLLTSICKVNATVLSQEDCISMYESVYSCHRNVAVAAGEFLSAQIFQVDLEEPVQKTRKGKPRSVNTPLIRNLIGFYCTDSQEFHLHPVYLVDALIEVEGNDFLKDWEAMTDLLLEEPSKEEEALDGVTELKLVEIMTCAVKQATTGELPSGRVHGKRETHHQKIRGDPKELRDEKTRMTQHFIQVLPSLLQKYGIETSTVADLLQIPQYFELELYTALRMEKQLDALLKRLEEIMEKHTDEELLRELTKTYNFLCNETLPIYNRCDTARSKLMDTLVLKFKESHAHFFQEDDVDEEDLASLTASIKKIVAFEAYNELSHSDLWDLMSPVVKSELPEGLTPEQLVGVAVPLVRNRTEEFVKCLTESLNDGYSEIRETSFLYLCDILILFGPQHAVGANREGEFDGLEGLSLNREEDLYVRMTEFLVDYVFMQDDLDHADGSTYSEKEMIVKTLHRRRSMVANYCKLIINGVMGIHFASEVFRFYVKGHKDYGDLIKFTLSKCREVNKITTARTLTRALTNMYEDIKARSDTSNVEPGVTEGWAELEALAKRFALTFGPDAKKSREAIANLHREGIIYAMNGRKVPRPNEPPPPNLSFLEIIQEFTSKLLMQDRRAVLNYLDRFTVHIRTQMEENESWQSLLLYRKSLDQTEEFNQTGRGRGRRRAPSPIEDTEE